jgi:hypothetical protein
MSASNMLQAAVSAVAILVALPGPAPAQSADRGRPAMQASLSVAKAEFSIDAERRPMASVVATVERHPLHGARYQWLILNFYAFPLSEENWASARSGDLKPIEGRLYDGDTKRYNNSNAKIVLSIDADRKTINQVDMAVPGYTCTVAWKPEELKGFSRDYSFANGEVAVRNQGSYACDMNGRRVMFGWNFDVRAPVFEKTAAR